MSKLSKAELCLEVGGYLACRKWLYGPQPIWRQNGDINRLDADWLIEEEGGLFRGKLAFRLNRQSTDQPSISLVFREKMICRIDLKPPTESDGNPPFAMRLNLKGQVYGPHIHRWKHNKQYILSRGPQDTWEIPIKEEISISTQSLGQIVAMICTENNIEFTSEQRDVTLPVKERLL